MEEHVYATGGYKITIRTSNPEHRSEHRHRHHQGEDTRTSHRQQHHGSYSQDPAFGEYAQGQGYPRLTAENLAAHERRESGNRIPQAYRRQEDDTAAQCGQRYPEEHRHRRQHSDGTARIPHNQHTHHAAHHGHRRESGRYETGFNHAAEGRRSGGGYVDQSYAQPYAQPHYESEGYQRQHSYDAGYHQPDRQELGQERSGYSYPYREGGSLRRRRASSSRDRDVPEWVLRRSGLGNVEEKSDEGSIQCEIEEVE